MTATTQPTWSGIPKVIWMLWCDGHEAAPDIVQACMASWKRHHPSWKLEVISRRNLDSWMDVRAITGRPAEDFTPVVLSDLLRMHVLAREGGIWVDATLYCCVPVESWLEPYMSSGFFAFRNPGPDRPLSSWFIACRPENVLMALWRDNGHRYWHHRRYRGNRWFSGLHRWLSRKWSHDPMAAQHWFRWWIRYGLAMHPYFWAHYLFLRLLEENPTARRLWALTPEYDAAAPHLFQPGRGLMSAASTGMLAEIENGRSPVYKLTWKYDPDRCESGSIIDLVIRREAMFPAGDPDASSTLNV